MEGYMRHTVLLIMLLGFALINLATGCNNPNPQQQTVSSSLSLPAVGNFRLSLTDAPHPSLTNVFVTVDHVELLLENGDHEGRLIVGQNIGTLDLLTLRDGVHLPIKDLNLKSAVKVKQFRLILKDSGHWIVRKADGSMCDLKTPSQQQTGLKLILPGGGVEIQEGNIYSLIVDFDVDHSIVDNKHGCLLKPVLKVKSLTEVPDSDDGSGTPPDDGSGTPPDDGSGTPPDDGSGTPPDDGSGTPPDDGSGTPPDDGSGTPPDDGSGTPPDDGSGTPPDDGSGTPPDDEPPFVLDGDPLFFQPR